MLLKAFLISIVVTHSFLSNICYRANYAYTILQLSKANYSSLTLYFCINLFLRILCNGSNSCSPIAMGLYDLSCFSRKHALNSYSISSCLTIVVGSRRMLLYTCDSTLTKFSYLSFRNLTWSGAIPLGPGDLWATQLLTILLISSSVLSSKLEDGVVSSIGKDVGLGSGYFSSNTLSSSCPYGGSTLRPSYSCSKKVHNFPMADSSMNSLVFL